MILLDTNILIYIINGDEKWEEKLSHYDETLAISVITYMEILQGKKKHAFEEGELEDFLSVFEIIPITVPVVTEVLKALEKMQKSSIRKVSLQDYMIGATAISKKIPLLTNNPKDFEIFDHLTILP